MGIHTHTHTYTHTHIHIHTHFPGGSLVKNPPTHAGDAGSIPGFGRSPGEGNENSLQYSGLESSMDRGAWWANPWECKSHT